MGHEITYKILGIIVFMLILYKFIADGITVKEQPKEDKKNQIIDDYKQQIKEALAPLENDNQKRLQKKQELLKVITDELSRNIFFDADENREIIQELSRI